MKCVDCGEEVVEKVEKKEIRATLSNPGNVATRGLVFQCTNEECMQHYANEEETYNIFESLEKERIKKES